MTLERAWSELTAVVAEVADALEAELHRRAGLLGSEYAVLAAADARPDRRASMTELGDAARLSPSGVTRVVGRLGDLGLLERHRDTTCDGRLLWVRLTPAGRERLAVATRARAALLQRELTPRLSHLRGSLGTEGDRQTT
ncbi:MAG TPA: MarR family transcriptional regulator [Jiangellales bacterium]|jgi:DNA-binding MarR family transcriptional regulator|nr:MarR family transcriptional regulator [Jiangellales bacterium]